MSDVLERAVEPNEIVRALKGYGVTQADVADATGVSDRAVRGWKTSAARQEPYDKLGELRELVLLLSDSLTPRGVGQWMHAKNRLLDGRRPIELLRENHWGDVRRAAQAFVDGSYV